MGEHNMEKHGDIIKDRNHWRVSDPYTVLQVKKGTPGDQIKKQYRKLCLIYHPDKVRSRAGGRVRGLFVAPAYESHPVHPAS